MDIVAGEGLHPARIPRLIVTMGAQGAVYADMSGDKGLCPRPHCRGEGHHRRRGLLLRRCGGGPDLWKGAERSLRDRQPSGSLCDCDPGKCCPGSCRESWELIWMCRTDMSYKRILTVQDLSCLGHCSGAVALPVLSAWGHETCLLPTALLSTHTASPAPYVRHLTEDTPAIAAHWKSQGIQFDGILAGYLGSRADIQNVLDLTELLIPDGLCIVDPAMGDHGRAVCQRPGGWLCPGHERSLPDGRISSCPM